MNKPFLYTFFKPWITELFEQKIKNATYKIKLTNENLYIQKVSIHIY